MSNERGYLFFWKLSTMIFAALAIFFGVRFCSLPKIDSALRVIDKNCKTSDCRDYNNTLQQDNKLDMNLLKSMAYYHQSNPAVTNGATNLYKTRSVWFSLAVIKKFIWQIENNACSCDSLLGIRMYFSNYPPDTDWQVAFKDDLDNPQRVDGSFRSSKLVNNTNPYEKISTLFMVPTIRNNNINYDFDPVDKDKNGKCLFTYKESYGQYGKLDTAGLPYLHQAYGASVTALSATNHGDACPPPYPPEKCPSKGAYFDY